MSVDKLIVYQGKESWTGKATTARFPNVEFENTLKFHEIIEAVSEGHYLAVLPMWNSNGGEISLSGAAASLFDRGIRAHSIWPFWIDFACIVRTGTKEEDIKRVISVKVAKEQCSVFLEGKLFDGVDSTPEAHKLFSEESKWDAVLCPPELCDEDTQQILIDNVADRLNFTVFALLGRDSDKEWIGEKWTELKAVALPKSYRISCIEMPSLGVTLTDEQHEMFDSFAAYAKHIDNIPKAIFVTERGYGRTGLIMEQKDISTAAIYPETTLDSDIKILNDAGTTKTSYIEEVRNHISLRYPDYLEKDFISHTGGKACFFACPKLNIMVHGFRSDIVESFIRESIVKHFEAIERGVACEDAQKSLFDKYKEDYHDKGTEFPSFEGI